MEIAGIVCGSLAAVVILVLVSLCVVKKWKLLSSYKTRRASSNPNNLLSFPCEHCEPPVADSDLNGLCEPSSIQCSQIVKRPPEIGEFVYMYMALTCFFVLQRFLCFIASRYCMFFILGNPVNWRGIFIQEKAQHKLTSCFVFPLPLLFRRLSAVSLSTVKQMKLFHSISKMFFTFLMRKNSLRKTFLLKCVRSGAQQAARKGGNFCARLTHLCGF